MTSPYLDKPLRSEEQALKDSLQPAYYECGSCGAWHSDKFTGDCRQDDARFNVEDIDAKHGATGWREVAM